ncbi:hypothetical protein F4809DRAFT_93131 [Biscogniauxia mediterranea]|nr:hypothetical protein F4809DRAFT_93131 [Biscogniauxia mediterranea]
MKVSYTLGLASWAAGAVVPTHFSNSTSHKALYFLENNPAGANIVAVKVSSQDGTLSDPVRTPTGGKGLIGLNSQGQAAVDTLFSQDAVVVSGNYLLTVNPGSNTVSLFTIPASDPYHPVPVGGPVYSGGDFPNTVAYSAPRGLACVANSGARSTVQCFAVTPTGLHPVGGARMPLPLANQTTPPLGPPNTVSDIVFNPEGTALFVSVKGTAGDPGYLYAYEVVDSNSTTFGAAVNPEAHVSRPAELDMNFSLTFLGSGARAFVSDPGFGGAFVDVGRDLRASVSRPINVTGQAASCWSQYSEQFGAVYVFDGGVVDVTVLDAETMDARPKLMGPAAAGGKFDSAVAGKYLYTLDGAASITAYSLRESRVLQTLDLSKFGNRQFFQGLAFYGDTSR